MFLKYLCLFLIFLFGSFSGVFSKFASQYEAMSFPYMAFLTASVLVLGVYAILWQQIIKRMPVTEAYMLKAMCGFIGLAQAYLIFSEQITLCNILGTSITIIGIILYARS